MARITEFAASVLAAMLLASVGLHDAQAAEAGTAGAGCQLQSKGNRIKHIVYLQFDNVHLRRDDPNVPSDLEQMPNLLNFLENNGTLLTNHHTPLISHTSVDILTALTGVYPDKFGVPIGNSIAMFVNGVPKFQASFGYWTDPAVDGQPLMIDQRGKVHPAPWVPFTRAGCDVGAFSIANIEFENVTTDINTVFGANSPEALEAQSNFGKAVADFEGISIHCARKSRLCAKGNPDLLPDEPGGYARFNALFGNSFVQPAVSPGGPVKDLDGVVISDGANGTGNPGFPGFNPTASQTLGYLAQMLEAGVPVVYGYIEDAHDNHETGSGTFGPGEAGYVTQLQQMNASFGKFFARLFVDGITTDNTLFIVTADENDHFVGGPPSPADCDGVTVPCTYAKKGEIDADLSMVFATEFGNTTPFSVHSDDAPTFYVNGNPGQTDPINRTLERQSAALVGFDPVVGPNGSDNLVSQALADQAEQNLLHMVSADPNRTPNFILFANPDYFLSASGKATPTCSPKTDAASCFQEAPGFAWNHGDFQNQITRTWLGLVGPGISKEGRTGDLFTDHTDIRPTIISLAGLKDDYAHDGRVLFEVLDDKAVPQSLRAHKNTLSRLAETYKAINAPRGALGAKTLSGISTRALRSSDATYTSLETKIRVITQQRNDIAGGMIAMLEDASFNGKEIDENAAEQLIDAAEELLNSIH